MKKKQKKQVFSFKGTQSSKNSIRQSQSSTQYNHDQRIKQISQLSSELQISKQLPSLRFQNKMYQNKIKAGIYRHNKSELNIKNLLFNPKFDNNTNKNVFNTYNTQTINSKILAADKQIQQNIRRRIQLQQQLDKIKKIQKQTQKYNLFQQKLHNQGYLSIQKQSKQYAKRNQQTYKIDKQIQKDQQKIIYSKPSKQKIIKDKQQLQINENVKILTGHNLEDIVNSAFKPKLGYNLDQFLRIQQNNNKSEQFKKPKNGKISLQLCIQPDLLKVQKLLNIVSFPQIPKQNLQQLLKKCQSLQAIHKPHSDIIYLNMAINFHLKNFYQVRDYFKQIIRFKKFEQKAYWIAAQTQYQLQNYQLCIKFTQNCIQLLDDKFLPRFIYLKAKSYYQLGSFTNSIVCYNQLIRIKPKISEYYLQRAIIYDKLGYSNQCKEDYLMFGILKPQAKNYLQQKIMQQQNDSKRKQLLQIYKKMI